MNCKFCKRNCIKYGFQKNGEQKFYRKAVVNTNKLTRINFLYNEGSELNKTSGFYDLPFRNYDAALGRFFQVDPLAHRDHDFSPFVYAGSNPIMSNDPSGLMRPYVTWQEIRAQSTADNPNPGFQTTPDWYNDSEYWTQGGHGGGGSSSGSKSSSTSASVSGYTTNNPSEIAAILQSLIDGSLYIGEQYFSIPNYEFVGNFGGETGIGLRDTGNSTWVEMSANSMFADNFWDTYMGKDISKFGKDLANVDYDPFLVAASGVNDAFDMATNVGLYQMTKGGTQVALAQRAAYVGGNRLGAILGGLGVGLTVASLAYEYTQGKTDTHSFVNAGVAAATFVAGAIALTVGAPVLGVGAAVVGLGYGVISLAGGDAWLDSVSNHWGQNLIYNK